MLIQSYDVLIIRGGMVGLSITHQLLEQNITHGICMIDK